MLRGLDFFDDDLRWLVIVCGFNRSMCKKRLLLQRETVRGWRAYFEAKANSGDPVANPGGYMYKSGAIHKGYWTDRCEPPPVEEVDGLKYTATKWHDLLDNCKTIEDFRRVEQRALEMKRTDIARIADHRAEKLKVPFKPHEKTEKIGDVMRQWGFGNA